MWIADFLNHFDHVRKTRAGWKAQCPEHDDLDPSLSIKDGGNRILLHCHAGCSAEAIVAAVGLKMSDLFSKSKALRSKRIVAFYDYIDESGALLFQVVRFEPKGFCARIRRGSKWVWKIEGARRVLYCLPQLLAADLDAPVFVTAGEKDCDNIRALGLVATTNPFGEGKDKWLKEYNAYLRDRVIVLLPDNDVTGRDRVEEVARSLQGVAKKTIILSLPNLREHGDISDWLDAGGTTEELLRLVAEAPVWTSATEASTRTNAKSTKSNDGNGNVLRVGFKVLDDGRIIEQVTSGFAIYDPASGKVSYSARIDFDGVTYVPLASDREVKFATCAAEYGSEAQLDAQIEAFIRRHLDISDRDRKICTLYAKLSYIADSLTEINYLRATGTSGSGKSRLLLVVGGICYRPLMIITPSPASIYRTVDRYRCTLVVDEFNPRDGDDAAEIVKLLNGGFMRGTYVPRIEKGAGGAMVNRYFDVYGAKLISSLKPLDSAAFESRCVHVGMLESKRNDIKYRISRALLQEQEELRNKLLFWRLGHCTQDMEDSLDAAEAFLRQPCYDIRPRHVQIGTPLIALIRDKSLKNDFAMALKTRTAADRAEQLESFDGQLAQAIHGLMFTITQDVVKLNGDPKEGEAYDAVPVSLITESLNRSLTDKRKYDEAMLWVRMKWKGVVSCDCS